VIIVTFPAVRTISNKEEELCGAPALQGLF